jgi:hypothetical protein
MSTPPAVNHLLANHTFGREHSNPPPLPQNIQMGQLIGAGQAGADDPPNVQAHDGGLPHDFDYLVRSVGEW